MHAPGLGDFRAGSLSLDRALCGELVRDGPKIWWRGRHRDEASGSFMADPGGRSYSIFDRMGRSLLRLLGRELVGLGLAIGVYQGC